VSARGGQIRWLASHLARSRAAKLALFLIVLGVAAGVYVLMMPEQGDLRPMLIALGGLGFMSIAGLFLGYRTLSFARRTAAENAALRKSLEQTAASLVNLERESRNRSAHLGGNLNRLTDEIDQRLNASLERFEPELAQIKALHADIAVLRDGQARSHTSQNAESAKAAAAVADLARRATELKAALDAAQALIAKGAARSDELDSRIVAVKSLAEASGAAVAGLKTDAAAGRDQQARDLAGVRALASEGAKGLESLRAAQDETKHLVAGVKQRIDGADARLAEVVARLEDLGAGHADTAGLAQKVAAGQTADRVVVARLQRELVVMADMHAGSHERVNLLAEQAVAAFATVDELHLRQTELEEALALANGGAKEALAFMADVERQVRDVGARTEKGAADIDDLRRQHGGLTVALAAVRERMASAVEALDQKHQALDGALMDVKDGLKAIGAEAGRIAAAITELDGKQNSLATTTQRMKDELARVLAGISTLQVDLAAASRQTEGVAASVQSLTAQTTSDVSAVRETLATMTRDQSGHGEQLKAISAHGDKLAAGLADAEGRISATAGRVDALDENLAALGMQLAAHRDEQVDAVAAQNRQLMSIAADRAAADDRISATSSRLEDLAGLVATIEEQSAGNRGEQAAAFDALGAQVKSVAGDLVVARHVLESRIDDVSARLEAQLATISGELTKAQDTLHGQIGGLLDELQVSAASADARIVALTGRLSDETSNDMAREAEMQARIDALEQYAADIAGRLSALGEQVVEGVGSERIKAVEDDIVQLVRLIDEAEIALAAEITRVVADTTRNSGEVAALAQRQADMLAALGGKVDVAQHKALAEKIETSVEGRLGSVAADITRLSRLVDETEIASVAELTRLSARVEHLTVGQTDLSERAIGVAALAPVWSRIEDVSAQLEQTRRATPQVAGKPGAGAKTKKAAAKSRGPAKTVKTSRKAVAKKAPAKPARKAAPATKARKTRRSR
jgi:chromosome segregation ATPase